MFTPERILLMTFGLTFAVGAADYFCGNRLGFGKKFVEGLQTFAPLFLTMAGFLVLSPWLAQVLAPAASAAFASLAARRWFRAAAFILYKHNIIPDLADAIPRNTVLLPPSEKAEEAKGTRHDQRSHLSLRQNTLYIPHIAKAAAVVDIDYFLAAKLCKSTVHLYPPRFFSMRIHWEDRPIPRKAEITDLV